MRHQIIAFPVHRISSQDCSAAQELGSLTFHFYLSSHSLQAFHVFPQRFHVLFWDIALIKRSIHALDWFPSCQLWLTQHLSIMTALKLGASYLL